MTDLSKPAAVLSKLARQPPFEGWTSAEDRMAGLDSLRGVAVLSILIFHYLTNTSVFKTPNLSFLQDLTSHLFYGVDLFFVLSGFLIGGWLIDNKGRSDYWPSYIRRRVSRIFPLYYGCLAVFYFLSAIGAEKFGGAFPWLMTSDVSGGPFWSYLVFNQNHVAAAAQGWGPAFVSVLWTIAIEVHFYAIAAILVALLPKRLMPGAVLSIVFLSFAMKQWGAYFGYGDHSQYVLTVCRLDAPFFGMFCAWLWRIGPVADWVRAHNSPLRLMTLLLLAANYYVVTYTSLNYHIPVFTMNAILCGMATLAFAASPGARSNILVRFLRWSGIRCFAIYVFHIPILGVVSHFWFSWPPNVFPPGVGWPPVIIAFLATYCAAALSWLYFEVPIVRWSSRMMRQLPARSFAGA
jgi:peptidoglycan/LPS O-acetylase OafA/YrhL